MNRALWIIQALLAILFLFTGITKLLLPIPMLLAQMPVPLPGFFLRFLGLCELSGALGLILPGMLRIRPLLTLLAAAGLLLIMIGATTYTVRWEGLLPALLPFVAGIFSGFVAFGRWRLSPLRGRPLPATLRLSHARG